MAMLGNIIYLHHLLIAVRALRRRRDWRDWRPARKKWAHMGHCCCCCDTPQDRSLVAGASLPRRRDALW
eukprot:12919294-Prorocentrum_lima.AAC.1